MRFGWIYLLGQSFLQIILGSNAFSTTNIAKRARITKQAATTTELKMSGKDMIDIANFAAEQSPESTRFITNKMCPFAQKVWIALEVLNAPYNMEEISLYGSNGKPDWFWDLNPSGTVPVLVCYGGGTVICDSDLVLDLILDGTILPSTDSRSSWMRQVPNHKNNDKNDEITKERLKLIQTWRNNIQNLLPIGKAAVHGRQQQKTKLFDTLQEMEDQLAKQQQHQTEDGEYLCGPQITVADCAAFPFLWRIQDEFGLDKYPKLQTWLNTCTSNKAFSKTIQSSWWWWW